MDELMLVRPDEAYTEEIRAYRQAFLDSGDSMDGTGSLRRQENPLDWIAHTRLLNREETCPPHWVPSTQFMCVRKSDGRIVGMMDVRHRFNDFVRLYAGNIGYSVRPDERRKGYAAWMLRHAMPYCRDMVGLKRILVTCLKGNEGSRRTILSCGGVYESTVLEPQEAVELERYWIDL